ncbi:hypothetical protein WNY37_09170 [Henriciella sp. AS95]|uniref:hypothetical protein n=1 Tax=Henriciella sp. AS95 TaxID=3135782 RepID=UPI00316EEECE
MEHHVFARSQIGPKMKVGMEGDRVTVRVGKSTKTIALTDVTGVRWHRTTSLNRTDFGLVVQGARRKLVVSSSDVVPDEDQTQFRAAVSGVLWKLAEVRPELQVRYGTSVATSLAMFLIMGVPAFFVLLFGILVLPEPGGPFYAIGALVIGAPAALLAWGCRPWQTPDRYGLVELADAIWRARPS